MSGAEREPEDGRPDDDTLAAEFVLGVLDAGEMVEVRRRALAEPAFAAAIGAWELRLAGLVSAVEPREPPPALWERIAAATAPLAAPTPAPAAPRPANEDARPPSRRRRIPDRRVQVWQLATAGMAALAAVFAAFAFLPRPAVPLARLASIAPIGGPAPAFVAAVRPDGTLSLVSVSPAAVPNGRDLELWVLPPGAKTVAPLGVLPAQGKVLHLPSVPATGTQLLVSLEPQGGSTTGQPTGPVLYGGTLASD